MQTATQAKKAEPPVNKIMTGAAFGRAVIYTGREYSVWVNSRQYYRGLYQVVDVETADDLVNRGDFKYFDTPKYYYVGSNYPGANWDEIKSNLPADAKILFIRDMGAGDVMLSIPTVRKIKKELPESQIIYATLPQHFSLLRGVNCIDKIASIHAVEFDERAEWDLIVNWTRAVENYDLKRNRLHRLDSFAAHLGLQLDEDEKKIELNISDSDFVAACELIPLEAMRKKLIGIVLQAAGWNRTWPVWKIYDLIDGLRRSLDCNIVIIDAQEKAGELFKNLHGVISTCGKTRTFTQAAAVAAMCDLVICPDSGIAHAMGAIDKKTLVLCGSIPPEKRFLYYPNHKWLLGNSDASGKPLTCCPCWDFQDTSASREKSRAVLKCSREKTVDCLSNITPEAIAKTVCEMLGAKYVEKNRVVATNNYKFESKSDANKTPFSVVVPACADNKNLSQNIEYIKNLSRAIKHSGGELIVVANGCCKNYIEYLKRQNIKYIARSKRVSYSEACNAGAEAAWSDIVCFMNSDVIIKNPEWHKDFISEIKKPEIGAVGAEGMRLHHAWCGDGHLKSAECKYDFLVGWCVWTRKDILRRVGGWDERYTPYYSEDADLSFKIKYSLGLELKVVDVKRGVEHVGGTTIDAVDGKSKSDVNMVQSASKLSARWRQCFKPGKGFIENIAILIPAHVKNKYLVECLDSVQKSGLKNQIVYVALDRMEFPERINYPDVKFYNVDFGSAAGTRNFLVGESVEPYIYFFDADDILIPGAVPKLVEQMKKGFDVVYGKARIIEESKVHWFDNMDARGFLNTRSFDAKALREGNYISTQSLVRRSALPSCRPFDERFPALEDWDLWLTMNVAGAAFSFCDIHLWDYRIHETNLTRDSQKNAVANALLREKHNFHIDRDKERRVAV